jgi:threonine/homoserine/homoserine lactone efflux protein
VLRGLPALLGVAAGMGLMMFVVAFGLGAVILHNPFVLAGVRWCGDAFLCWLAWKIATAAKPAPRLLRHQAPTELVIRESS